MIIETRYRDIPDEEIHQAHSLMSRAAPEIWERMRGRPVLIETPAITEAELTPDQRTCGAPWYRVVRDVSELGRRDVCTHLAEIGD